MISDSNIVLGMSGYQIVLVPNQTRTNYRNRLATCDCAYCENFHASHTSIPKSLVAFLDSLGVEYSNPVYISEICENPDGSHLYTLVYDVVGRVISVPDSFEGSLSSHPLEIEGLPEDITARISLAPSVPGHFPPPAVEFEFFLNLPWMLDESP